MAAYNPDANKEVEKPLDTKEVKLLNDYLAEKFTPQERAALKQPKYFYEVTFDKPGGMLMPIIAELTFTDGGTETYTFPVQIWRKNNQSAIRVFATDKRVTKITLDPKLQTADVDVSNNTWPKTAVKSKFDQFEEKK